MPRPSSAKRGYSTAWRTARAGYLAHHPFCVFCHARGQYVLAEHVDHIIPHKGDKDRFWNKANWQPLCTVCHNGAKQKQETHGVTPGCDTAGKPLDESHHWNQK